MYYITTPSHPLTPVPPEIEFNVSPSPPYKDRTVVTIGCTVNRVSPTLKAGGMSLGVVGETFKEVKATRNQDSTYHYVVTRRHMITKKDDNKEINCKVVTNRGKHYKKSVLVRLVREFLLVCLFCCCCCFTPNQ